MKFTIEVEDFWLNEEELDDALKSHVMSSVTRKITESIQDKIDKEITHRITEVIEKNISSIIDIKLNELIETGTIVKDRKEIQLSQHIKNLFMQTQGWSGPRDQIERFAKKYCAELKLQYDAAFATKIVMGMKDQGLIKPEVVQMLLENNGK